MTIEGFRHAFGEARFEPGKNDHPQKVEWYSNERGLSTDVGSWVFYANEEDLKGKDYLETAENFQIHNGGHDTFFYNLARYRVRCTIV